MFKKWFKLFGGLTPPTPFVTSIEADFALMRRVNTRAKYMQVQVIEFVRFEKVVFLHFSGNSHQVYCCCMLRMGSVCMAGQTHKSNSA